MCGGGIRAAWDTAHLPSPDARIPLSAPLGPDVRLGPDLWEPCPGGASAPRRTGFLSPRPGLGGPRRPSPTLGNPVSGLRLASLAAPQKGSVSTRVPSLQHVRAPPSGPLSRLLRSTVSKARVPPSLLSLCSVSHGGFLWSLLLHCDQNSCSVNAQGH